MQAADKCELLALLEEKERRLKSKSTVVGIVSPDKGHLYSLSNESGDWQKTTRKPDLYIAEKLEKALRCDKRYLVLIGGRGSTKSVFGADDCLIDAKDNGKKTYFLREFQSSIKNSVHSLLKDEIKRLNFPGFEVEKTSIKRGEEDVFQFAGIARNVDSIKSSHGFSRYSIEEAQFLSQDSLDALTPTARNKPKVGLPAKFGGVTEEESEDFDGVSFMFIANPQSREDPFSKRFIVPYEDEIAKHGYYEDDLHLIIKINYDDNPWFDESGLEQERQWAYENLHRAYYDHIWLGEYNDSIENSLIDPEWFDACIDAHKKLGFELRGALIASHDASDLGGDSKSYVLRHGSVILDIQENTELNVNDGARWATGLANQHRADYFTWDADGMGVALGEQIAKDFEGKKTTIMAFKGSETPDNPDAMYRPALSSPVQGQVKTKDAVRNKRAQYYCELRDRIYLTYRAIVHNEWQDPEKLISFSSDIMILPKVRAELCRIPVKPNGNGLIELYTKQEMRTKFKFMSPNLGDGVMMNMRYISHKSVKPVMPRPLKPMGRTNARH